MDKILLIHFAAALFAIMNPLGNLPVYISSTAEAHGGERRWVALLLTGFILVMLIVFFWAGESILNFFGVRLSSFRIAGGILLLLSGIGMVRGHAKKNVEELASRVEGTSDLRAAEGLLQKILIPVGIPLFVGPGSISTVILFAGKADTWAERLWMSSVLVGMCLVIYLLLMISERIGRVLGPMGLDIAARMMGLVLAAIGVQFMLEGLGTEISGFLQKR
ncbi:MAG: MarC family protein [Luteolibacter sp.]